MIVLHNSKDKEEQISQHFKGKELICRCGKCPISIVSDDLLDKLEILRRLFGQPLTITSCYRCWVHNQAVGGKEYSRHQSGMAVDIAMPTKNKDILIKLCHKIFKYSYHTDEFIHVNV